MDNLKNILKFLLNNDIPSLFSWEVYSTIIVALMIALFNSKAVREKISKFIDYIYYTIRNSKIPQKEAYVEVIGANESDILNHDIFNYIDFWLHTQIPTISLKTSYRTVVFKKYLHIFFNTHKQVLKKFVNNGDYKEMDRPELRKAMVRTITEISIKYEQDMLSEGIPEVIITKMKVVIKNKIDLMVDLINNICDSPFYDSNYNFLKVYSFLSVIHSILDNTLSNASFVCDSINGELAGLYMDGETEPF